MRPDRLAAVNAGLGLVVGLLLVLAVFNHGQRAGLEERLAGSLERIAALEASRSVSDDAEPGLERRHLQASATEPAEACSTTQDVAVLAMDTAYAVSANHELLAADLAAKADASALSTLATTVAAKAVVADTTAALALKADQTEVDTLTTAVGTKATIAALDLKADSTAVTALAAQLGTSLAATAGLANDTDLVASLHASTAALTAQLGAKAERNDVGVLARRIGFKANASSTVAALAFTASQAVVDILNATVSAKANNAATTAALGLKADQTVADTLTAAVSGNADTAASEAPQPRCWRTDARPLETRLPTALLLTAARAVTLATAGQRPTARLSTSSAGTPLERSRPAPRPRMASWPADAR